MNNTISPKVQNVLDFLKKSDINANYYASLLQFMEGEGRIEVSKGRFCEDHSIHQVIKNITDNKVLMDTVLFFNIKSRKKAVLLADFIDGQYKKQ